MTVQSDTLHSFRKINTAVARVGKEKISLAGVKATAQIKTDVEGWEDLRAKF